MNATRIAARAALAWVWVMGSICAAYGQPGPAGVLEEVVVTAQKRAQSMQEVPLAVSALAGDSLQSLGISNPTDLSSVIPSLDLATQTGAVTMSIRGVSSPIQSNVQDDSPIPLYLDGTYQSKPGAMLALFQDIERIEVLRGPQGTLYGRNATGGAINVISKRPVDEREFSVDATVGNYDARSVQAVANMPLIRERLAMRVVGSFNAHDAYERSLVRGVAPADGADEWASRVSLAWQVSDALEALFRYTHYEFDDTGASREEISNEFPGSPVLPAFRFTPPPPQNEPRVVARSVEPELEIELNSFALELNWQLSERWALKSLSGHSEYDFFVLRDQNERPGLPPDLEQVLFFPVDTKWTSQEVNLTYTNPARYTLQTGLYYFTEKGTKKVVIEPQDVLPANLFTPVAFFDQDAKITSYAAFGQLSWMFLEDWELTAGLRYSDDEKSGAQLLTISANSDRVVPGKNTGLVFAEIPTPHRKVKSDSLDYMVGVSWRMTDEVMLYGKVSSAYKAGGFNFVADPSLVEYQPEEITAVEFGLKSDLIDDRLRLNGSFYYYDYDNLQITQILQNTQVVQNSNNAVMKGLEIEMEARPAKFWSLSGFLTYLDSEYKEGILQEPVANFGVANPVTVPVDIGGNQVMLAPEWSARISLTYKRPVADIGTMSIGASVYWQDDMSVRPQGFPNDIVEAYTRTDLVGRFDHQGGHWYVEAFARNLEDETVLEAKEVSFDASHVVHFRPPRTYGLNVGFRY